MTTHVLRAGDGYGCHFESGLRYVTLCGRRFDPAEVDREPYERPSDPEHPHANLCFDCSTVDNGGSVNDQRRGIHFDGGTPR